MKYNKHYKLENLLNKMRIMPGLETLVKGSAFTGLMLATSVGISNRANAVSVVPSDFFATDNNKIIQLANYDSVVTTSNWDDYYSNTIKWNDIPKTDVSTGYRVWTLDSNKKPCGVFNIATPGKYGFLHTYKDDTTTPAIDEGASAGDVMSVLVQEIATNKMYNANFVDGTYNPITVNFNGDKGRYDKAILVGSVINPTNLYWDTNGSVAGAGTSPNGNWTDAAWNIFFNGTGSPGNWASSVAVFSAGTDATGSYNINVSGTQQVKGMTFEEGNATLSNGTLELITDSTFLTNSSSNTVNTKIIGAGKLTKTGSGTLVLSGSNDYSGGTIVNQGILNINSANALPAGHSLTIGAGGTVVLASGLSAGAGAGASLENKVVGTVPEPSSLVLAVAAGFALGALGLAKRLYSKED